MDSIEKHFSHEHPLIFNDGESLDAADDAKPRFCSICGLIIFINSYYSCSHGCRFLVHEICAHRLTQQFRLSPAFDSRPFNSHPCVDASYTVMSLSGPIDKYHIENDKCLKCGQICNNYTYSNPSGQYFHPLCLVPLEIATKHRSHDHPLSIMRKEICAVCNSCGEEESGFFWSCQTCDYWISQDCALIPPVTMHASHSHPLVLFYTNSFNIDAGVWFSFNSCRICRQYIGVKSFYSCGICQYNVHLKCIKSSIDRDNQDWRKLIVHFPAPKKKIIFLSFIAYLEQDEEHEVTFRRFMHARPEEIHNHPLIFNEVVDNILEEGEAWESKLLCNACINPIDSSASSYYSCSVAQCHFLVHELCVRLPFIIKDTFRNQPSPLVLSRKYEELVSVFYCFFCKYECNGLGYRQSLGSECVDVECALAPRIIQHASHKNHYFHLTSTVEGESDVANCCHVEGPYNRYYKCTICPAFKIHLRCALLPPEVRHKFDEHPLQLIADGGNLVGLSMEYLENCGFCDVCENPMDPSIWFYYCSECDQYFHVNCIPSVGKLSKIKFGGTLDRVGCHDHPVTSVRMLTIGSQKCTYCNKIIQGFQDDYWAFHCESCNVWIHKKCARK
ncbi:uncharacterized protein [Henckelia pumila]|uniref:uncharacterized protein n=1 Tax=Henckelia pumila TaxID=405737 RepID=UPI003C6E10FC